MFKQGAFEKKYDDTNTSYPLGETGVLAFRINSGKDKDGNLEVELSPEKGQGVKINLNDSLLYMFFNLLTQGIEQTEWGLNQGKEVSMKVH